MLPDQHARCRQSGCCVRASLCAMTGCCRLPPLWQTQRKPHVASNSTIPGLCRAQHERQVDLPAPGGAVLRDGAGRRVCPRRLCVAAAARPPAVPAGHRRLAGDLLQLIPAGDAGGGLGTSDKQQQLDIQAAGCRIASWLAGSEQHGPKAKPLWPVAGVAECIHLCLDVDLAQLSSQRSPCHATHCRRWPTFWAAPPPRAWCSSTSLAGPPPLQVGQLAHAVEAKEMH